MLRIAITTSRRADAVDVHLAGEMTAGRIARYFAHVYGGGALTLEYARLLDPDLALRDQGVESGDRIILMPDQVRRGDLPAPLSPDDLPLSFARAPNDPRPPLILRGKTRLTLGKLDMTRGLLPEIDARTFLPAAALQYISRECARFDYDPVGKLWTVRRLGVTRLVLDDYELPAPVDGDIGNPVPFNGAAWLTFYRGADDPRAPDAVPLGRIFIRVDRAAGNAVMDTPTISTPTLDIGGYAVTILSGVERGDLRVDVGGAATAAMLFDAAAELTRRDRSPNGRFYHLRLTPPRARVDMLTAETRPRVGDCLYVGRVIAGAGGNITDTAMGDEWHTIVG